MSYSAYKKIAVLAFLIILLEEMPVSAQMMGGGFYNSYHLSGFGGDGNGWQLNHHGFQPPPISGDVLTLTDGKNDQARCAFSKKKISLQNGFHTSFIYVATGAEATLADGMAFVIQNSDVGSFALGGTGGAMGYENPAAPGSEIKKSLGVEINLYADSNMPQVMGYRVVQNGVSTTPFKSPLPVVFASGREILISMNFLVKNKTLSIEFKDLQNSQNLVVTEGNLDLPTLLEGRDFFLGFCGATGALTSTQIIKQFKFSAY